MGVSKLAIAVAVMLMVVVSERPAAVDGALTCGQVTGSLGQCIGYLTKGGAPPPACCSGVVSLNSKARTTPDRKQACNCLKSLAASIRGLNYGNAASLPGKCNVKIPYAISPSTDCNKVT